MDEVLQHPRLGPVTLTQSPRARRITLTVRPSGTVRLSYPCGIARTRALAFLENRAEWVVQARERLAARAAARPTISQPDIETLRRAAQAELPGRVAELARLHGFRYGRVTIRASRSKWGSCSGQNNLSLSLFLMTLPQHLRDFVLLHELCHTVHHNHSPRFHALLARLTGGKEKLLSRELRSHTIPAKEP